MGPHLRFSSSAWFKNRITFTLVVCPLWRSSGLLPQCWGLLAPRITAITFDSSISLVEKFVSRTRNDTIGIMFGTSLATMTCSLPRVRCFESIVGEASAVDRTSTDDVDLGGSTICCKTRVSSWSGDPSQSICYSRRMSSLKFLFCILSLSCEQVSWSGAWLHDGKKDAPRIATSGRDPYNYIDGKLVHNA